ncbi:TetR family transcriptional regulator [Brevibacterium spongiae]|uniref:TetR family transcriptional regulator n=1 Tax=Brevibacterium spongiae TaxID=2909672 RepID=A0ABY5STQ7_9MICO|nr:TetR family transcriptional regulator [Brevibacterium spongiae]UVI37980.1 TetR family transcriptional regulator [Brevibacterium spongiae]
MRRLGREALVGEALTVLAANPQASMIELSQSIGVGRTTLYRHFGDREALVAAAARLGARRFGEAIMRARPDEGTGLAALERICAELFTLPDVLTLLFADNPIITDKTFAEADAESRADDAEPRPDDAESRADADPAADQAQGADDDGDPLEAVIARGQADGSIDASVPIGWAAMFVFLTIGSGHLFSVSAGVDDPTVRAQSLELTIGAVRKTLGSMPGV